MLSNMSFTRLIIVLLTILPTILSFRSSFRSSIRRIRESFPLKVIDSTIKISEAPKTFMDCVKQAASATRTALNDGKKLIEVEFPPLPLEVLEDSSSSARDITEANTKWATEFAKYFVEMGKISIIYPDQPELDDAIKYVGDDDIGENVTLATIRADSIKNAQTLDQIFSSIFGATVGGTVVTVPNTAMYIALVSSTQELPDLEKLYLADPKIPIVFFNLRLDVLRGDLGLPLFPGRDLHHRFLSKILPAFYMRSRSYATSLRVPPFIVNYSGLLYRVYPGPYQCILNIGSGKSKLVKTLTARPTNVGFREAITDSLIIPGVSKEDLKSNNNNLVWWEKETDKSASQLWME